MYILNYTYYCIYEGPYYTKVLGVFSTKEKAQYFIDVVVKDNDDWKYYINDWQEHCWKKQITEFEFKEFWLEELVGIDCCKIDLLEMIKEGLY